jgi:16S rRNA processing protein RimM
MTSGFEQVGKVIKVHGLKGELIIEPNVAEPTQLESIEVFYVKNKRGDVEPYRVEQSKIIEKSNRYSFFVKFVSLNDRSQAEQLRNKEVMIPAYEYENLDQFEFSFHECIEWEVFTEHGIHVGKIIDVMDNTAQELLEVRTPEGVVLIPAVDEYIASVDMENEQLIVKDIKSLMEL